jgi:hypothetical protein
LTPDLVATPSDFTVTSRLVLLLCSPNQNQNLRHCQNSASSLASCYCITIPMPTGSCLGLRNFAATSRSYHLPPYLQVYIFAGGRVMTPSTNSGSGLPDFQTYMSSCLQRTPQTSILPCCHAYKRPSKFPDLQISTSLCLHRSSGTSGKQNRPSTTSSWVDSGQGMDNGQDAVGAGHWAGTG